MNKVKEQPFIVNGMKSWVHCINLQITDPTYVNKDFCHYHDYIELLYSVSTNDYLHINEKCYNFTDGDFAVINSEEPHKVTHTGVSSYICIKFSPHILYSDEQSLFEFKYVIPFLSENLYKKFFNRDEIADTPVPSLIFDIMREWEEKETGYELVIRANILRIFAHIFRCWNKNGTGISDVVVSNTMKRALKYISENYDTATEKEAAKVSGLSYSHFSRVFKKELKQNFNNYLVLIKLREAEKMLISTDNSITEIAHAIGFSTASHFISHFKKHKQITPMQFRKKTKF